MNCWISWWCRALQCQWQIMIHNHPFDPCVENMSWSSWDTMHTTSHSLMHHQLSLWQIRISPSLILHIILTHYKNPWNKGIMWSIVIAKEECNTNTGSCWFKLGQFDSYSGTDFSIILDQRDIWITKMMSKYIQDQSSSDRIHTGSQWLSLGKLSDSFQ